VIVRRERRTPVRSSTRSKRPTAGLNRVRHRHRARPLRPPRRTTRAHARSRTGSAAGKTLASTTSRPARSRSTSLVERGHARRRPDGLDPASCSCTAIWPRPSRRRCATGCARRGSADPRTASALAAYPAILALGLPPRGRVRPARGAPRPRRLISTPDTTSGGSYRQNSTPDTPPRPPQNQPVGRSSTRHRDRLLRFMNNRARRRPRAPSGRPLLKRAVRWHHPSAGGPPASPEQTMARRLPARYPQPFTTVTEFKPSLAARRRDSSHPGSRGQARG